MSTEPITSSLSSTKDRVAVLAAIYRQRTPSTVRSIAKSSRLSTLVIIPVLSALVDEELVVRRAVDHGPGSKPTWSYQLSAKGRRTYQSQP
ncbi:hypothetical protein BH10ACT1_BH10ACT1_22690 [soil metagenome]